MTTGYLVATGRGPYSPLDLGARVPPRRLHPADHDRLPAAVAAGDRSAVPGDVRARARTSTSTTLALKLPVIAATVGLAYLVAAALREAGAQAGTCRRAWAFVLFNPLILFAGAAWGQIDVIVALLAVAALVLVWRGRWASSAALLSLAVCTKPTPLPIALVVLVWLAGRAPREALRYAAVFLAWATVFVVVPVVALGWRTTQIEQRPNAQFLMTGGLSYTTVARLFRDPLPLPGHWWLVGMLWVVALAAGLVLWRRGESFDDLIRGSAALMLVFLLTRAWLAEPNVVLVLPLVLILASLGELDRRLLDGPVAHPAGVRRRQRVAAAAAVADVPRRLEGVGGRAGRRTTRCCRRCARRWSSRGRSPAGGRSWSACGARPQPALLARGGRVNAAVASAGRARGTDRRRGRRPPGAAAARRTPPRRLRRGLVLLDRRARPLRGGRGLRRPRTQARPADGVPGRDGADRDRGRAGLAGDRRVPPGPRRAADGPRRHRPTAARLRGQGLAGRRASPRAGAAAAAHGDLERRCAAGLAGGPSTSRPTWSRPCR